MTEGFRIDGHFIPISYDTNDDRKLQSTELSIFCRDNDLKYDNKTNKIISAAGDYSDYDSENKLDDEKYSLENLKKRYPEAKYTIDNSNGTITVINKETGKKVITIVKDKDGTFIDMYDDNGKSVYFRNYDKNGNLLFYDKDNQRHYPLAENIYKAVSVKKGGCIATTDVNKLVMNVKRIIPENILDLATYYEEEYGESLIEAIENEWGLDKNIKQKLIQHINKCAYEAMQGNKNSPNCKIDKDFKQGDTGDCWFLASIAAVQRSPKGQEILNSMITDNHDGTYTVKFKGANKEYKVDSLEILTAKNLAKGDLDVKILEIAAKKHFSIMGINGGNPATGLELLCGTGDKWKNVVRAYSSKPDPKEIKKLLNNKNIAMTASIDPLSKLWGYIVKDVPKDADYKEDVGTAHAYAVVDIDDNNIYLKNPWSTDKTIAIPLDIFNEYWGIVQYTEIT